MKLHPCRNCLIIPICRQREWVQLIRGCPDILREYIFSDYCAVGSSAASYQRQTEQVRKRISRTHIELNPTRWKPAFDGDYWAYEIKTIER